MTLWNGAVAAARTSKSVMAACEAGKIISSGSSWPASVPWSCEMTCMGMALMRVVMVAFAAMIVAIVRMVVVVTLV